MPQPRNYLNRCYTFLAILAFVSIATLILLAGKSDQHHKQTSPEAYTQNTAKVITTEDVVNGKYYARGANCTWTPDGTGLSWLAGGTGDLIWYGVKRGVKRVVVKAEQFVSRPWKVKFSGDGGFVLVGFEPKRLFRSTILARYAVHSTQTGKLLHHLSTTTTTTASQDEPPEAFQLAIWNNDNKTILLVHKNDLYAVRVVGDDESRRVRRLTWDGSETVFNGVADWVYEEELFTSTNTAVYPSPTGSTISYLKFNDTCVQPSNYNLYGDYSQQPYFDEYFQYPKFGTVRYPKSGTTNPTVSIHIVRLGDETCWDDAASCTWEFDLNQMMSSLVAQQDSYLIGSFKWIRDDSALLFTMNVFNRIQNSSWITECNVNERGCSVIKHSTQSNGWIDSSPLHYHDNEYFGLLSVEGRDGLEYGGIVGVRRERSRVVTSGGLYTVDEVVGVYTLGGNVTVVVFKSGLIGGERVNLDSTEAHYYSVELGRDVMPTCLSCYGDCSYSNGKFSPSGEYFVNTCEGEGRVSRVELVRLRVVGGRVVSNVEVVFERNLGLERRLAGVGLPEVEYFRIPYGLGGRNYSLSCKVVGPRGWKLGKHKYPVVVDIYGGPNSQKVTRRFTPNDWSYSLASNHLNPTVYLTIDGIGSGRQSNSMAFEVYRDLGDKEITDKIYAVKWFLNEYSESLDERRVLVWGWSYGGYVAGMIMGKDVGGVFGCGVSVAPVVNWYYYDTLYTERYLSTPEDNPDGYKNSSILNYLGGFVGKDYLLIHGNADDNVHYQQSMVLARGLEQRNVLFRMQSYPDENHSLGSVRPHLFATLEDFVFNQCFRKRATIK